MTVIISRLFKDYAAAQSAVKALEDAGIPEDDISIIANNADKWFNPDLASAAGKGAAVGAVGGHLAHHNGVLGAAVGCAVGHHIAKKKSEKQVVAQRASESAQNNAGVSTPAQPNSKKPINP